MTLFAGNKPFYFLNPLGKGLTPEISGDGGSNWSAAVFTVSKS